MAGNLTDEEFTALQEYCLLQLHDNPNMRKISSYYRSPPAPLPASSVASSSTSVRPAVTVSWASPPPASPTYLVYPVSPVSIEALEFIGLTKDAAEEVFANFQLGKAELDEDDAAFPAYIKGHVKWMDSEDFEDLSTEEAYTKISLSAKTINTILDPIFEEVCRTKPLFYWAWDTLGMNFNHLLMVEEKIRKTAKKAVLAKGQGKSLKVEEFFCIAHGRAMDTSPNLPPSCTYLESVPTPPDDHIVLYMGNSPAELGIRHPLRLLKEDHSINIGSLASNVGGDFNNFNAAWYFTTEYEMADIYRRYAATRCPHEETWIIRMAVPIQMASTLRTEELEWSDDFRDFVWHCRTIRSIPAWLQQYGSSDVLKGPVLRYPGVRILDQEDIYGSITRDKLLSKPGSGQKATQWVVMNWESAEKIERWSRGNLHIENFAARTQQRDATTIE